jgi:C4-dicarboxylate-specific signal transduction histidine kinase
MNSPRTNIEELESKLAKKESLVHDQLQKIFKTKNFNFKAKDFSELLKVSDLEEFTLLLSKIPPFKSYHSIITLNQKKGNSQANVYDKKQDGSLMQYSISSTDFHEILTGLKKSRETIFFNHHVISTKLNLVGFFIAKFFKFREHDTIIILSKGLLLSPQSQELEILEQNLKTLERILVHVEKVNKHKLKEKITHQFKLFTEKKSDKDNLGVFHAQRIKLLGELFNFLKHELSNPLFGINLSIDILKLSEPQLNPDLLKELSKASARTIDILESMTSLFNEDIDYKNASIFKFIENIKMILKSEIQKVCFTIEISEKINESTSIKTNLTYLTQIIFNLIINATQELVNYYESKADRRLNLQITCDHQYLYFRVKDNGRGVEDIKKAFNAFYTTKEQGTGLGLHLSRDLSIKIGGNLYLEEKKEEQTSFCLQIPL